ncbi:hypothetical protein [Lancefieldella parvula]|uniref:hypothetical protein n=1 Tax=Lancefieldella parvula TaxID=1382 RepID=UPI00288AC2B1|nr:hypothetical protein [Lancefieldella parvula]
MNAKYLDMMNAEELEDYAQILGFTTKAAKTKAAKVQLIETKRSESAEVEIFGTKFVIPKKKFHDKTISDLLSKPNLTDDDFTEAIRMLLGDDQYEIIYEAVHDEDGTIDIDGLILVYKRLFQNEALKNF